MRMFYKRKKTGTSLIEIVIAMLIIACSFLPILRIVDYGSVSTTKVGHYSKATRLAQDLIEECKHVPFKVYQVNYDGLETDQSFDIHPEYYKDTKESIEAFKKDEEKKDKIKEFAYKASLRPKRDPITKQIIEIWFEVEMNWYDKGQYENNKGEKRTIKVGNAYYNAESLF